MTMDIEKRKDEHVRAYFRELLYNKQFKKASELSFNDLDIIMDFIQANIDNGYLIDAREIALKFMPKDPTLLREIEKIIAAAKV